MTNTYNVHIYREMRLVYEGIATDNHQRKENPYVKKAKDHHLQSLARNRKVQRENRRQRESGRSRQFPRRL